MCVNRVTHETIEGREFIRKERNPFSWILIVLGNFVFRFRRAPVRVLHRRQWQQWEKTVQKAMGLEVPSETARGLMSPKVSGQPLLDVVDAEGELLSFDDVNERLRLALEALYRLHQIEIDVNGKRVLFSHGDASITNAIIADDQKSAIWLDFDLRHDLRQPAYARQAEDLRAFMMTGIACLAVEEHSDERFERFMQTMKVAYPNKEVWQGHIDLSVNFWSSIDIFFLAQQFRAKAARCSCLYPK